MFKTNYNELRIDNKTNEFSIEKLVEKLYKMPHKDIIPFLFENYGIECMNMHKIDSKKLDSLLDTLNNETSNKKDTLTKIIMLVRSVTDFKRDDMPIVDVIKSEIQKRLSESFYLEEIASSIGISKYYMCHLFKETVGISIKSYEKELKLSKAKDYLVNTDMPITDIAYDCGYRNSSYFSKIFVASEKITPGQYRKMFKDCKYEDEERVKDVIFDSMLKHMDILENLDISCLKKEDSVKTFVVSKPSETFNFLHETAIIEYKGILFAAWYNNEKCELHGETPIRFSRSFDNGKKWSTPKTIISDKTGKMLYCPPVFGICEDKLYMLMNQMIFADHIHALDLYVYNEKTENFEMVWSKPTAFKLNTNVYTMPNGKLILSGRTGKIDGFPNTPAVLISDSGKIDGEWRIVKIQNDGTLIDDTQYVHPEVSLIICRKRIYAFCRNDAHRIPIIYFSEDFGETWSEAFSHNVPFSSSKIYSGKLSDGKNYIIGNLEPDRNKLVILFSKDDEIKFVNGFILQEGCSQKLGFREPWHYPSACEHGGKLYVIYSAECDKGRGAVVSVVGLSKI